MSDLVNDLRGMSDFFLDWLNLDENCGPGKRWDGCRLHDFHHCSGTVALADMETRPLAADIDRQTDSLLDWIRR